MYPFNPPPLYSHPGTVPATTVQASSHLPLRREDVTLTLRQQPKEALVTTEGKEKARKPVDPPPIIQLSVKPQADPAQHFLQSPYLFMCTSLYKVDKNEAWDGGGSKSLAGSLVSSLHRLKDVDNKDGGFFVFGDISVKVQGSFRLHFSLFDLQKDACEVQYLGSITSDPFKVLLPKDFKGMDESTYLSRAFSDQGVRLRLRKEPRAMMGNKRPYPYAVDTPVSNTHIRPNMSDYPSYDDPSPNKRFRHDSEDVSKPEYSDHSAPSYTTSYTASHYAVRQPSLAGMQSVAQYLPHTTVSESPPFAFRSGYGNTSNYLTSTLLPTSSTPSAARSMSSGTISSQQRYPNMAQQSYSSMLSGFGTQAASTMGIGEEHRPATATGIPPSMSIAQQTSQNQQSSHQHHDSIGSSTGGSYSSPDAARQPGFADRYHQLAQHLPNPTRQTDRYDDQSQLATSLFSGQRNSHPVLSQDEILTSHTDTGIPHHSLPYDPDLGPSTEEQFANSR